MNPGILIKNHFTATKIQAMRLLNMHFKFRRKQKCKTIMAIEMIFKKRQEI